MLLLQHCIESWSSFALAIILSAGFIPRIGNDQSAAYLKRLGQWYFEMQRLALVPPKPKLFVSAFLTVRDCDVFAT
jgi:hypothetical protein